MSNKPVTKVLNGFLYKAFVCKKCGRVEFSSYENVLTPVETPNGWLSTPEFSLCPEHAEEYRSIVEQFFKNDFQPSEIPIDPDSVDIHFVIDGEDGYVTVPKDMGEEAIKAVILDSILDEPLEVFERD